jgi:hypothetical protein
MARASTEGLWESIFHRDVLLIDVLLILILCTIHFLSWPKLNADDMKEYRGDAQTGIRAAATAGLTVAGILIPLSVLAVQLRAGPSVAHLPRSDLVDFFVSDFWLLISVILGLYVLFYTGLRGYQRNILASRPIGVTYGWQLIFLGVGVFRLVFGMAGLVSYLIRH